MATPAETKSANEEVRSDRLFSYFGIRYPKQRTPLHSRVIWCSKSVREVVGKVSEIGFFLCVTFFFSSTFLLLFNSLLREFFHASFFKLFYPLFYTIRSPYIYTVFHYICFMLSPPPLSIWRRAPSKLRSPFVGHRDLMSRALMDWARGNKCLATNLAHAFSFYPPP